MTGAQRRIRLVGIGAGDPGHVTSEAARALREVDFVVVVQKRDGDPLVAARHDVMAAHGAEATPVVVVRDPERVRDSDATSTRSGYETAVFDWHEARAEAFERVLVENPGDAGFLVWGDPAFYDSTIRVVERVRERGRVEFDFDVIPGISALHVLAAKHRIVLHEVGQSIHVTTGRRLAEAVEDGQDNIVVMLDGGLTCADLPGEWAIWWGANLGTPHEALVAGRVPDVIEEIRAARDRTRTQAGWVMDTYLLRRSPVAGG